MWVDYDYKRIAITITWPFWTLFKVIDYNFDQKLLIA